MALPSLRRVTYRTPSLWLGRPSDLVHVVRLSSLLQLDISNLQEHFGRGRPRLVNVSQAYLVHWEQYGGILASASMKFSI